MRIFRTDALGNPIFGSLQNRRFRRRAREQAKNVSINNANSSSTSGATSNAESFSSYTRTTLFLYVLNRNWEWVLRRARTHPHEIGQFDNRTGDSPIHAALRLNPPSQVVRALLAPASRSTHGMPLSRYIRSSKGGAQAAGMEDPVSTKLSLNRDGWTALHVAATNHCSRQVLQVLVEHDPSAVFQLTLKTKRTPIHCAAASFRGIDREAFFYLLNVSGEHQEEELSPEESPNVLCLKDSRGKTPLALLFSRYRERVKQVCQQMESLQLSRGDALALVQRELGSLWEKARGIVERLSAELGSAEKRASHGLATPNHIGKENSIPQDQQQQGLAALFSARRRSLQGRRFRLVHASVGLIGFGCPPEMIRLAVSLYPHQASEFDEDGNLPLHLAALAYEEQALAAAAFAAEIDDASMSDDFSASQNHSTAAWDTHSFFSESTAVSTIAGFSRRKSAWDQVFDMLLQHCPHGARTPQQPPHESGKIYLDTVPLVLAMRSCTSTNIMSWRRDGLERLMHAYPPALHLVLENTSNTDHPSIANLVESKVSAEPEDRHGHHHHACFYPHLLALLLTRDWEGDRFRLPRTVRMDASQRRRTPLDIARMTAVYSLLQTSPEMVNARSLHMRDDSDTAMEP